MRGLDPRIHRLREKLLRRGMDCRVTPGNDGVIDRSTMHSSCPEGIHVLLSSSTKDVDGRDKPGHDARRAMSVPVLARLRAVRMQPTGARNNRLCFRPVIYRENCNRNVSAALRPKIPI